MMKKMIFLGLLTFGFNLAFAQSNFKININKSKKLILTTGNFWVNIEGYDGDELLIDAQNLPVKNIAQAKGLKKIDLKNKFKSDSVGYKILGDTTDTFNIWITGGNKHLYIKIPNGLKKLDVKSFSSLPEAELIIKNMKDAFSVNANIKTVNISQVSGFFNVSSSGKIIVKDILWKRSNLPNTLKPEYKIVSKGSDVDLFIPIHLKANFTINTNLGGHLYTDPILIPAVQAKEQEMNILLEVGNGAIYIRKQ